MHGYELGSVQPTTALVLSHKHPDDYGQVAATIEQIRRTAGAFRDFLGLSYDEFLPTRAVYDRLLLTAHLRV
jgi:hypothetical protein